MNRKLSFLTGDYTSNKQQPNNYLQSAVIQIAEGDDNLSSIDPPPNNKGLPLAGSPSVSPAGFT
jgi:hypothetical protein